MATALAQVGIGVVEDLLVGFAGESQEESWERGRTEDGPITDACVLINFCICGGCCAGMRDGAENGAPNSGN